MTISPALLQLLFLVLAYVFLFLVSAGFVRSILTVRPVLVLTPGDVHAKDVIVIRRGNLVVGRDDECQLQIVDGFTSGRHASLRRRGDSIIVRDLGSKNGTFVNGVRVTDRGVARNGDVLTIGRRSFRVVIA